MTRRRIIAGNWKMHKNQTDALALAEGILKEIQDDTLENTEVIFCPPALYLSKISELIPQYIYPNIQAVYTGAQNCYPKNEGAFTGEISPMMIKSVGARYVILGHSERRQYFNESDSFLADKTNEVLSEGLFPIFCCGEVLEDRNNGNHFEVVKSQITNGVFHLSEDDFSKVIIAYEPVWAIGTGVTASPDQAQEMHAFIRSLINAQYGEDVAQETCILYGGSVKPDNASELFNQEDIDGGLIGGAALKVSDFVAIIRA